MSLEYYQIRVTRRAEKDIRKLSPKLNDKLYDILTQVIALDPFIGKKLIGDLAGSYSYPLSYQDRVVYSIDTKKRIVYLERAKTHYGE